jgi:hypothetical protein
MYYLGNTTNRLQCHSLYTYNSSNPAICHLVIRYQRCSPRAGPNTHHIGIITASNVGMLNGLASILPSTLVSQSRTTLEQTCLALEVCRGHPRKHLEHKRGKILQQSSLGTVMRKLFSIFFHPTCSLMCATLSSVSSRQGQH